MDERKAAIMKKKAFAVIAATCAFFACVSLNACKKDNQTNTPSDTTETYTDEITSESLESNIPTESTSDTVTEEVTTEEETEDLTPKLTGENAKTIELAQRLAGGINAGFTSPSRGTYAITNKNAVLNYNLSSQGNKMISSLENTKGGVYFSDSMDVFVKSTDGITFLASESLPAARVNIYRMGYYYYDVHFLDQSFLQYTMLDETPYNVIMRNTSSNQISKVSYNKDDGSISFSIAGTQDPYVAINSARFQASKYNALEITMRCSDSSKAELFIAAGSSGGFNGSQRTEFSVTASDEFFTYIIPISNLPDYTGYVNGVRIDIGSKIGETVEIKSIKAINVDIKQPNLALDRTIHAYSDKMNHVIHLVATDNVSDISSYGTITKISESTVEKIVVKDASGTKDSLSGVDSDSIEYIGLDIKNVGIFGYILLADESSGKLRITLEDGYYVIIQEYNVPDGTVYQKDANIYMGCRLYTDRNHTFDDFLFEAYCERNPLENIVITEGSDGAAALGYNVLRGAYVFSVNGTNFVEAYNNPSLQFKVNAGIKGDDKERKIYVYSSTIHGSLECGVIMDSEGSMLPIKPEVCKNFQGENEEPLYDKGDRSYGEIIFPMVIEPESDNKFTIVNLYQNWGNFPLKQISSIQFIAPYYHLSTGVTETNCIAPYYVYAKDLWTLPDFRSMSAPLWASQPQHTSAGRLYFLQYTDKSGLHVATESTKSLIDSSGPTYSDIYMDYVSDDGKIKVTYRHAEMPQTDENRTYYEIRIQVLDDIEIENFKDNFSFFSMDGRAVLYSKLGYLNDKNECTVTNANMSATPKYYALGKNAPYFDYYSAESNDYVNFALLIKNSDITIGGEKYDGNFVLRDALLGGLNYASLTLDLDNATLKNGDVISIDMILVPWGSQLSTDDSNIPKLRENTCLNPYKVTASTGSVIEDSYIPKIMSKNNRAEFTLSGGANNAAVRVYGFDRYTAPKIYEKINGEWVEYKVSSSLGYDGYVVYYDGDGTFSYSFIINTDSANERTFKIE